MRIELPLAPPESTLRADDDAHTLTVAPSPTGDWTGWHWACEPGATVHAQVDPRIPVAVTLTM
jgi:hypothetical protein